MTDREIYDRARAAYGPVFAIRVWSVLLNGGNFAAAVRRSLTNEFAGSTSTPRDS